MYIFFNTKFKKLRNIFVQLKLMLKDVHITSPALIALVKH
ncbi:hypothetical protein GTCCBUS3UF5_21890 [Geobacillus thermoleovorans CCB_US3_UF5]|uniref:Uncharacterized protein n=1 Tax=Geobacillus thermoleovorans CCB_US3_UF5 TaxID=1111068 RepID=A0ABM5MIH0_GEOTH|nr:hypothetical protein GTCCBUS3UF5_21890 [Geobacillus thermoleovorans CCB_US3_UF5]